MGWLWNNQSKKEDEGRLPAPATSRNEASETTADAANLVNSIGRPPTAATETRPSQDVPSSNPLDEKISEPAIGDSLDRVSRADTIPESSDETKLAERPKNPRQGSRAPYKSNE
jgi:hypothetical protein